MKLLIDDANIENIKRIYEYYAIDGVTTNPSILAKNGHNPYETLKEIREFIGNDAELHVQVVSKKAEDMIAEASNDVAIFQSYNTSFGVSMLVRILKGITKDFYDADFDIEILEKHHHRKIDAPSGTAKLLYQVMEQELPELEPVYDRSSLHQKREHQEVGIQAIRGGTIFGEHSIYFAGLDEIIEIKHTALSRDVFATGAIQAAKTLMTKDKGLYSLKNIY